jgi:biotin carboxylase
MADPKPHVLLLGGSCDQRFIIATARTMGLGTVVVDLNPHSPGFADADFFSPISTRDAQAIIAYAEDLMASGIDIRGISVMGSDIPHIVAQVADRFGWAGPSAQTAAWATHKFAMKERLQAGGIPVPRYARVHNGEEIRHHWKRWHCRQVVVKPVDQAGSRGVWCIDEAQQADAAFAHAHAAGRCKEVMVEEFVPGPQVSTESILADGRSATPGLVDRCYETTESFHPQIIENGGWYPSRLPPEQQLAIQRLVEKAAGVLGITAGVAKGDVVVCPKRGPMLIEMAARLSGGDFSESLIPLGCGVNYVEAALRVALGLPVDWPELQPKFEKSVINRYFFLPPGRLQEIRGASEAATQAGVAKFELFVQVGDDLPAMTSHGARSGVFIVVTDHLAASEALAQEIYTKVTFKIDGRWHCGHPQTNGKELC